MAEVGKDGFELHDSNGIVTALKFGAIYQIVRHDAGFACHKVDGAETRKNSVAILKVAWPIARLEPLVDHVMVRPAHIEGEELSAAASLLASVPASTHQTRAIVFLRPDDAVLLSEHVIFVLKVTRAAPQDRLSQQTREVPEIQVNSSIPQEDDQREQHHPQPAEEAVQVSNSAISSVIRRSGTPTPGSLPQAVQETPAVSRHIDRIVPLKNRLDLTKYQDESQTELEPVKTEGESQDLMDLLEHGHVLGRTTARIFESQSQDPLSLVSEVDDGSLTRQELPRTAPQRHSSLFAPAAINGDADTEQEQCDFLGSNLRDISQIASPLKSARQSPYARAKSNESIPFATALSKANKELQHNDPTEAMDRSLNGDVDDKDDLDKTSPILPGGENADEDINHVEDPGEILRSFPNLMETTSGPLRGPGGPLFGGEFEEMESKSDTESEQEPVTKSEPEPEPDLANSAAEELLDGQEVEDEPKGELDPTSHSKPGSRSRKRKSPPTEGESAPRKKAKKCTKPSKTALRNDDRFSEASEDDASSGIIQVKSSNKKVKAVDSTQIENTPRPSLPKQRTKRTPKNNATPIPTPTTAPKRRGKSQSANEEAVVGDDETSTGSSEKHSPWKKILFSNSASLEKPMIRKWFQTSGMMQVDKFSAAIDWDILVIGSGEVVKTSKLLKTLARGKPIATDAWLAKSASANKVLDPETFCPKDLDLSRDRSTLFRGLHLFITPALKKDLKTGFKDVEQIAGLVGAESVVSKPARDAAQLRHSVVLALEKDDLDAISLIDNDVTCYTKELLSTSVLRGVLDLDDDEFKIVPGASQAKRRGRRT